MGEKILIDTGPSERGFHRLEAHMRCPRLYALGYGRGGSLDGAARAAAQARFPPSPPLVRGSIGHAGLAHLYARLKAEQEGSDPDRYFLPTKAMELVAQSFGALGAEMLPIATKVVAGYAQHYSRDCPIVLGVEEEEETVFGGYRYTARVDLEWEDRAGKVWFADHKLVNKIESKVFRRYVLSGQFLGLAHLGSRKYGDRFGGVQLNLLGVNPIRFFREVPEPAPWALEHYPETVKNEEEAIKRTEELIKSGLPPPMHPSEFTCWNSYGECPAFEICRWGDTLRDKMSPVLDSQDLA